MKKIAVVAVSLLFLSGCGFGYIGNLTDLAEPFPNEHEYVYTGIEGAGDVLSEVPLVQERVRLNILLARAHLIGAGILKKEEELTKFADLQIYVRSEPSWEYMGEEVGGNYDIRYGIQVGSTMGSLLHEYIHHIEYEAGIYNTFVHPEWEQKGYNALSAYYGAVVYSITYTP